MAQTHSQNDAVRKKIDSAVREFELAQTTEDRELAISRLAKLPPTPQVLGALGTALSSNDFNVCLLAADGLIAAGLKELVIGWASNRSTLPALRRDLIDQVLKLVLTPEDYSRSVPPLEDSSRPNGLKDEPLAFGETKDKMSTLPHQLGLAESPLPPGRQPTTQELQAALEATRLPPKEYFARMVRNGTINAEGQLTKLVGGEAEPEPDTQRPNLDG